MRGRSGSGRRLLLLLLLLVALLRLLLVLVLMLMLMLLRVLIADQLCVTTRRFRPRPQRISGALGVGVDEDAADGRGSRSHRDSHGNRYHRGKRTSEKQKSKDRRTADLGGAGKKPSWRGLYACPPATEIDGASGGPVAQGDELGFGCVRVDWTGRGDRGPSTLSLCWRVFDHQDRSTAELVQRLKRLRGRRWATRAKAGC